jgi:hypothetical protein
MPHTTVSIRAPRKLRPKKNAARGKMPEAVQKTSLSRAALRLLVSRSATPPHFDQPPEAPPFDLQDK